MMYKNVVKMARQIIAKGQFNKLVEYLVEDSQKSKQQCTTKVQQIQKQSFNFPWFAKRFVAQHKHYQDIQGLLKITKAYSKINKELRTFQFENNKSFSDFNNFMENYLNKNIKNQEFKSPTYCKLIHSDSKYNYYYADAKDKKCYQDLHKCNTKADGQQYAMWCVVNGTVTWGQYINSEFPFYVYVTYKNNIPIMLFNFGYDYNAQIKDIHDNTFTQYDYELLNSIKQLAKKYNFDISKNSYDFRIFNKTDELYSIQIDYNNIIADFDNDIDLKKYNGLYLTQQGVIVDLKKNKKAYLIADDHLINLSNYKIDINVLSLLKDSRKYDCIQSLIEGKFIEHCSNAVLKFIIVFLVWRKRYEQLYLLIKYNKIKDEKSINQIVQLFIQNKRYDQLCYLIEYDKIKDEKVIDQIAQLFIQNKQYDWLRYLIKYDIIKDEKVINQIIQLFIQNKKYVWLCSLIKYDKIKDEKLINQIILFFIQDKKYDYILSLIGEDKIKDKKVIDQIIPFLFQNKRYYWLRYLIEYNKIKDEKLINQIIQCFIQNKQYDQLYYLIKQNKIKDEKLFNQIILFFIQNKRYYQLGRLREKYPELTKKIEDAKNSSNVKVSHIYRELLDIAKSISR